jgi:hypothetical protein
MASSTIAGFLDEKSVLTNTNQEKLRHSGILLETAETLINEVLPRSNTKQVLEILRKHLYPELLKSSSLEPEEQKRLMSVYIDYVKTLCGPGTQGTIKKIPSLFDKSQSLQKYLAGLPEVTDFDKERMRSANTTLNPRRAGMLGEYVTLKGERRKEPAEKVERKKAPVRATKPRERLKAVPGNKTYRLITEFGKDETYRSALKPGVAALIQDIGGNVAMSRPKDETASVRDLVLTTTAVARVKSQIQREAKQQLLQTEGDKILKIIPVGLPIEIEEEVFVVGDGKKTATIGQIAKARLERNRFMCRIRSYEKKFEDSVFKYFESIVLRVKSRFVSQAKKAGLPLGKKRTTSYEAVLNTQISGRSSLYRSGIVFTDPATDNETLLSTAVARIRKEEKASKAAVIEQRRIVEQEIKPYLAEASKILKDINADYYERCCKAQSSSLLPVSIPLRKQIPLPEKKDEKVSLPLPSQIIPQRARYDVAEQSWDLTGCCKPVSTATSFTVDGEAKKKLESMQVRVRKRKGNPVVVPLKRPLHINELAKLIRYSDYKAFDEVVVDHTKEPLAIYNENRIVPRQRTTSIQESIQTQLEQIAKCEFLPLKYFYTLTSACVTDAIDTLGCQWAATVISSESHPINGRLFLNSQRQVGLVTSSRLQNTTRVTCVVLGKLGLAIALKRPVASPELVLGEVIAVPDEEIVEYNPLYASFDEKIVEKIYRPDFTGIPLKYRTRFYGTCASYESELMAEYCNAFYPYPETKDELSYFPENNVLGKLYWNKYGPHRGYSCASGSLVPKLECSEEVRQSILEEFKEKEEEIMSGNVNPYSDECIKSVVRAPYKSLEHPFSDCTKRITIEGIEVSEELKEEFFHIAFPIRVGITHLSNKLLSEYYRDTINKETDNPAMSAALTYSAECVITGMLLFQSGVFYLAVSPRVLNAWSNIRTKQSFSFDFIESPSREQLFFIKSVFGDKVLEDIGNPCQLSPSIFSTSFFQRKVEQLSEEIDDPSNYYGPLARYESIVNGATLSFNDYSDMKANGDLVRYAKELRPYLVPGVERVYEGRERIEKGVRESRQRELIFLKPDIDSMTEERKDRFADALLEVYESYVNPSEEFKRRYHWALDHFKPKPRVVDDYIPPQCSRSEYEYEVSDDEGEPDRQREEYQDSNEEEYEGSDDEEYMIRRFKRLEKRESKVDFSDIKGSFSDYMFELDEDDVFGVGCCPCLYNNRKAWVLDGIASEYDYFLNAQPILTKETVPGILINSFVNKVMQSLRTTSSEPLTWEQLHGFYDVKNLLNKEKIKKLRLTTLRGIPIFIKQSVIFLRRHYLPTGPLENKLAMIVKLIVQKKIVPQEGNEENDELVKILIRFYNDTFAAWNVHQEKHLKRYTEGINELLGWQKSKGWKEQAKTLWRTAEIRIRTSVDFAEWAFIRRHLQMYIIRLVADYYTLGPDEPVLQTLLSSYVIDNNEELLKYLSQ